MKFLMFFMFVSYFSHVQPADKDRHYYCESCLTTAGEIEKSLKEAPAQSRSAVIENLLSGGVCEKLLFYKNDDRMKSACMHLLDSHRDQFHSTLVNKEPKNLDIVLCYEQSTACVGVKRHSFQDSASSFSQHDIEALIQQNKDIVRITKPTHSASPVPSRDEL